MSLHHSCHSGSMQPAFYRGDLLFLTNYQDDPVEAGEILVFKVKDRDIPIVHRVIKVHERCSVTLNHLVCYVDFEWEIGICPCTCMFLTCMCSTCSCIYL